MTPQERRNYDAGWRERNRESIRAYAKAYRLKHLDKTRQYEREYWRANRSPMAKKLAEAQASAQPQFTQVLVDQ